MWVHLEVKGYKLGERVREGQWMGISDESKGVQVYWPDKKMISTEQNIYLIFDSIMTRHSHQFLVSKGRNGNLLKRNLMNL